MKGPAFAERSAKVVNKYSYSALPMKSITAKKSAMSGQRQFANTSLLQSSQKNYLKSMRTDVVTFDHQTLETKGLQQSAFMSRIAESNQDKTFGNDRSPFYSQYDREQASLIDHMAINSVKSQMTLGYP